MNADSTSVVIAPRESPSEAGIMVALLSAVEESSAITQRTLSQRLGIALGLTNAYLRRCVSNGLITVSQSSPNRYKYYLTPAGFTEKSRLTAKYLAHSFEFVRGARAEYVRIMHYCEELRWYRVALCGSGELSDIALLSAEDTKVVIAGIVDPTASPGWRGGFPIVRDLSCLDAIDAAILTDYQTAQSTFDSMIGQISEERALAPLLLHISRKRPSFLE